MDKDVLKKLALLLFFILLFLNLSAWNSVTDSLLTLLKTSRVDSSRVKILNDIAWEYHGHDLAKTKQFANEALILAKKTGYQLGEVSALNNLGYAFEVEGQYMDALRHYTEAASLCEKISPVSNKLAGIYNNIGVTYSSMANYPEAIRFMKKALQIKIARGDESVIGGQLHNIGILYYYMGQLDKALEHYYKALKILERHDNKKNLGECYNSIGAAYSMQNNFEQALQYYSKSLEVFSTTGNKIQLANCFDNIGEVQLARGLIDEAERNFLKALELREALGYKKGIADCINELGDIAEARKNYSEALEYKLQALPMMNEGGNKREMADCMGDIGRVCNSLKKYPEALSWYRKSIALADSLHILSSLYNSYSGISIVYENMGQYKTALEVHRKFTSIGDSLFNEKKNKKISDLEMQYEMDRKEQQNQLLAKENELQALTIRNEKEKRRNQFIILTGVIVLIVFVSLFFYTRYRYHHLSVLEEEKRKQEQLRFKMVIDAEEKERARIANELHDGLGNLLSTAKLNISGLEVSPAGDERHLLDNSMNLIDEACNEVRAISHNLMPVALMRQGLVPAVNDLVKKINDTEKINVAFNETMNGERIDRAVEIALYRIIQEILNNMIRHAQANAVSLSLNKEDENLSLTASDNGTGFDVSEIDRGSGIGWKSIFSRVNMMDGIINIDSRNGKGTTVKIEIPV